MPKTRRELVFFILGGFFLTNAILAEITGGKLFVLPEIHLAGFTLGGIILPIGLVIWPVVFISTDLVNEYYGKAGVRRLTFLTVAMISYAFVALFIADLIPAWPGSPVSTESFHNVFAQSRWIIVGSLIAFLVSQFVDVAIFAAVKRRTAGRLLWLRATGSTVVSQLVDTVIIQYIAFVVPQKLSLTDFARVAGASYVFKLSVAILITPLIYLGHALIDKLLEPERTA